MYGMRNVLTRGHGAPYGEGALSSFAAASRSAAGTGFSEGGGQGQGGGGHGGLGAWDDEDTVSGWEEDAIVDYQDRHFGRDAIGSWGAFGAGASALLGKGLDAYREINVSKEQADAAKAWAQMGANNARGMGLSSAARQGQAGFGGLPSWVLPVAAGGLVLLLVLK